MKNVLVASFDMEIGGVERSLISMLNNFDYNKYNVDLMLYSHTGDFMNLIPNEPKLLEENIKYKTFRMPIKEVIKLKFFTIGLSRILAKAKSKFYNANKPEYIQMQYMWKYALPFLPKLEKTYDIAISYLWPHYFVADKVKAKTKIAWIHTDYSTIETNINMDLKMWNKFDYIISVSNDCTKAFLKKYPELENKILVVENITSPEFVKRMAEEEVHEIPMNSKDFKILSVGRYSYAKGFDNAIKAMKLLKDREINNVKWYVIGYGADEQILRNLITEYDVADRFFLLGKKTNPYSYMKKCDVYIQPSRYEGKAVTVTEAQILGKPVMITNYTTAKSQVRDGFDGYISDLSVEGISNGIEKLYKDKELRHELSNNCKNNNYSNAYELEKLYRIFKEI